MKKPILFLIFNRPDTTKKVFEAIRKYRPKELYIAADGPRPDKDGEKQLCEETRKITENIDWDCEVKTLFREENLGCRDAVSSAITWFFENVEDGIILEDDCLPNQSFFRFCEKMLDFYKSDNEVSHINGANYLDNNKYPKKYFFSRHYSVWGWATWKNKWSMFDKNLNKNDFKNNKAEGGFLLNLYYKTNIKYNLHLVKTNTWDIQWATKCFIENTYSCTPTSNLVKNIGVIGSHTKKESKHNNKKTFINDFNSIKKEKVVVDKNLDKIQFKNKDCLKSIFSYYIICTPIKIKRCLIK